MTTRDSALLSLHSSLHLAEKDGGSCEIPRWRMAEIIAALSSYGGREPRVDKQVIAKNAGGHCGPTYRCYTYEVTCRFSIVRRELPWDLPVHILIFDALPTEEGRHDDEG